MQGLSGAPVAPLGGGTPCGAGAGGSAAFATPEEELEYFAYRYKVDHCSLRIPHDWCGAPAQRGAAAGGCGARRGRVCAPR
jgi:hypothetical protein